MVIQVLICVNGICSAKNVEKLLPDITLNQQFGSFWVVQKHFKTKLSTLFA